MLLFATVLGVNLAVIIFPIRLDGVLLVRGALLDSVVRYVALGVFLLNILGVHGLFVLVNDIVARIAHLLFAFFLGTFLFVGDARIFLIDDARPPFELAWLIFERGSGRIFLQNFLRYARKRLVILRQARSLGV